ncbi:Uncharacterised protein [Mycobacteroides abscessus subsp. abscessus]|nr:Uncharacterised protein [Mycobacteroides abscessus subsp. abscessus]
MSGITQERTSRSRGGRHPLSHEKRVATKASLPAWALGRFVELADMTGINISDLAGICLIQELNRLRASHGEVPLVMPSYLAEQAALLVPQRSLLEVPLFEGFDEQATQSQERSLLWFRVPASISDVLAAAAADMHLPRSHFSVWLALNGANHIRRTMGLETVHLPSELVSLVKASAARQDLEARLVS